MTPIRIGIVGCGEVAQIIHLPTLRGLRGKFAVTALCDVSARVRDGVGEAWGIARRFADHRALAACPEVDAVLVANPNPFHAETALAAMAEGKHVLLEKPHCMTLAEADALIAAEHRARVVVQVGYMRRYAPAFTEAKALLAGMKDIRLARVHDVLGRNALIIGETSDVIRPTDLGEAEAGALQAATAARIVEAIGEAPQALQNAYALLLGLSSHDLSAMRELLGMPRRVLYAASRGADGRALSAAFDYGEFVCNFESTIDQIPRFDAHIEVYTPTRTLRVQYDTPYIRNMPGHLGVTDLDPHGHARTAGSLAWRDSFQVEWEAFHANVTAGTRPKTSLDDARQDLMLFRDMIAAMRLAA